MPTSSSGADGMKKARGKLRSLAEQGAATTASLGAMDEARQALRRICDQHASLAKSFEGMHELGKAGEAMRAMGAQVAKENAKWQEAADSLTTRLNSVRGGVISDTSLLGSTTTLHDLVSRNHDLSIRLDNRIADLAPDIAVLPIENPIHETNEKLDKMLTMQVDLARLHQSLNETTIAFLADFRNVAQTTLRQTRVFMGIGFLTLIAAIVGTWLNFAASNDITTANQELVESLTDRIVAIQSDLALQSADEREAMLAEQRRLIEQLINSTQAVIEQQAIEQRAAIERLRDVAKQSSGDVKPKPE